MAARRAFIGLLRLAVGVELPVFAQAIDFVDKDDRRLTAASQAKEFADAFGPDADVDFVEIAAVHAEEIGVRFAGDGLGEHGFTGAGRANQDTPLGSFPPSCAYFFGVAQEVDDFLDFALGFFDAGDVLEADAGGAL